MPDNTEPCPSCGRPTPVGTRCVYCATVTDLDLKSLQLDYLKQSDAKPPEEPMGQSVVIVVVKTGQKYTLAHCQGERLAETLPIRWSFLTTHSPLGIMPGSLLKRGDFWIEDLGSTNGTLLNGHPVVKRQVLSAGDKVRVGHTELTFRS
jgi:hypothetical protein